MSVKVVTPEATASYANVFTPRETPNGDMKYSISLLFPKESTDMTTIKAAIEEAIAEKWGKKRPKDLRIPVRDGDEKDQDEYHGHWFINANSSEDRKPKIVGPDLQPIIDSDEFYSGCICRASINFYPYDTAGNKGIGAGLNAVMKVKDGEPLGNVVDPQKEFAEFASPASSISDDSNDLGF